VKFLFLIFLLCCLCYSGVVFENDTFRLEVPPLEMAPPAETVYVDEVGKLWDWRNSLKANCVYILADGEHDAYGWCPFYINKPNITIRGASEDPTKVIVNGGGFTHQWTSNHEIFAIHETADNFTIANMTIRDVRTNAIKFQDTETNNTLIHNVVFYDIGERCIKGPSAATPRDVEIRYCWFEQISEATDVHTISGNDLGNYLAGMDIMSAQGLHIHDNAFVNIRGKTGGARGGIFLWGGSVSATVRNVVIERNLFYGCDRSICMGNPSGVHDVDSAIIRNNFIMSPRDNYAVELCNSSNLKIYNNTFYCTEPAERKYHWYQNMQGNVLKNNIMMGTIYENGGDMPVMENNIELTTAASSWFVNPLRGDLHLTSSATQAIDKGLVLDSVLMDWDSLPRGDTPDIGADESNPPQVVRPEFSINSRVLEIISLPNPFSKSVEIFLSLQNANIKMQSLSRAGTRDANFKILNLQGEILQSAICNLQSKITYRWNARGYPSGIYLVHVKVGNKILTRRIVKAE
jgi:hypothetical protein